MLLFIIILYIIVAPLATGSMLEKWTDPWTLAADDITKLAICIQTFITVFLLKTRYFYQAAVI
jgi:low affinity Fe/Cu permease